MTAGILRQTLPATTALTKLGTGGEGIVYDLPAAVVPQEVRAAAGGRPIVYKEFLHPDSSAEAQHHRAAVGFLAKLGEGQREWLLDRAAWPVAVVVDGNAVCGILMPKIPDQFFRKFPMPSGGSRCKEADFQMLLNGGEYLKKIGIGIGKKRKLGLLIKVAELLRVLQGSRLVVGDLSAKNLLFSVGDSPDDPGSVYLIDCDSVSTPESANLSGMETPGWSLPEGEKTQTQEGDRYKFALLVLRVLAGDQMTRDVADLPSNTPAHVKLVMRRSLSATPADRPRFQEWVESLQAFRESIVPKIKQKKFVQSATAAKVSKPSEPSGNSHSFGVKKSNNSPGNASPKSNNSTKSSSSKSGDSKFGAIGCILWVVVITLIVAGTRMVMDVIPWPWKDEEGKPTIDSSWCTAADEIDVENALSQKYPTGYFPNRAKCPDRVSEDYGKDSEGKYYISFGGDPVYLPKAKGKVVSEKDMNSEIGQAQYVLTAVTLLETGEDINDYLPVTSSTVSSLEVRYVREHQRSTYLR